MQTSFLNKIYLGDCVEVMKGLYEEHGAFVDLMFADPPYNLEKAYEGYSDDMKEQDYLDWCNEWLTWCVRLLKPTGTLLVLNLPKWAIHHAITLNNHLYMQNWIVWDALSDPRGRLMPAHYALLHYTADPENYTLNDLGLAIEPAERCLRPKCIKQRGPELFRENLTNIWHDIHRIKHKRDRDAHPCQLPEKLLDRVIRLTTNPSDVVFDPFVGTGTTMAVAKRLGRLYVGSEYDPSYVIIAEGRLNAANKLTDSTMAVQLPLPV